MNIKSSDLILEGWVDYDTLLVLGRNKEILDSYLKDISHLCISIQKEHNNHATCIVQDGISIFKEIISEKGFNKQIMVFIAEKEILELDSILDKINSSGIDNLSFRENQFLDAIKTYSK